MNFPLLDTSFFGEQRRINSLESSRKYQLPEAQSSAIWLTESSENISKSGSVQLEDGLSTEVQSITEDDLGTNGHVSVFSTLGRRKKFQ